jgi:lipooligosaccharide transport system permease protein
VRAGTYGCVPMLVAMVFGLPPSWGMLVVPLIGFTAGFGWASFGIMVAALLKSIDNFSYVTSTVITPLFLVAGTFFPLSNLPRGWQIAANINPLFHTVELVRHAVFGFRGWVDVGHVAVLLGFAILLWRLAIRFMERKLID